MKDILDPTGNWLGAPPRGQFSIGNKRPVALDDTLAVVKDSGAVTVDVLANDFDPEGQPLNLLTASAALGTAVAETDNTVTYTPPPGISGFDTVVYEIEDDLGQTRSAQINITITEPQLSIDAQPDNTLVVTAETGLVDVTVTTPVEFAGTWQVATADLLNGPVNLVVPGITGLVAEGEVLTAEPGLWAYDTGSGLPVQGWQWRRGGAVIPGATGMTYTVTTADVGPGLTVGQTLTDGFGQREAVSAVVGAGFVPSDDASLIGWWDADDAATITEASGAVSSWANKVSGGDPLVQTLGALRPDTGTRALNGRNVLDFDGGDLLEMALSVPSSGDVAFHLALEIDSVASQFAALFGVDAAADFQIDANNASQFDGRLNATGIGSSTNLTGGPYSGAMIVSVVFDQTGSGNAEVYVSNTLRGTMAYTAPISSAVTFLVMTNRSQNAWINGSVAEILVTGDVSNRASHHGYLATKWGLT